MARCAGEESEQAALKRRIAVEQRKDSLFLERTLEVSQMLESLEELDPKVLYALYRSQLALHHSRKEDEAMLSQEFHTGALDPATLAPHSGV